MIPSARAASPPKSPRLLKLEFRGASYNWFDLRKTDAVFHPHFVQIFRQNIVNYFDVPLERQLLFDDDGLLLSEDDVRRTILGGGGLVEAEPGEQQVQSMLSTGAPTAAGTVRGAAGTVNVVHWSTTSVLSTGAPPQQVQSMLSTGAPPGVHVVHWSTTAAGTVNVVWTRAPSHNVRRRTIPDGRGSRREQWKNGRTRRRLYPRKSVPERILSQRSYVYYSILLSSENRVAAFLVR